MDISTVPDLIFYLTKNIIIITILHKYIVVTLHKSKYIFLNKLVQYTLSSLMIACIALDKKVLLTIRIKKKNFLSLMNYSFQFANSRLFFFVVIIGKKSIGIQQLLKQFFLSVLFCLLSNNLASKHHVRHLLYTLYCYMFITIKVICLTPL